MSKHAHHRGFTLLEVLVAIAIFALFSAMAYGGLVRLVDIRDRVQNENANWRAMATAFVRIEDDLSRARPRPVRDIDGRILPALRGQPTDTRAVAEPSLEFTRGGVGVISESARSDLQRVGYRLRDGELLRLTWPALDRAPITRPEEIPLLEGVETFEVRFYSPTGAWIDQWPPSGSAIDILPRAVEFTLELNGHGQFTRMFLVNG